MVASALQLAARALVRTLLALATQYAVVLDLNRYSSEVVLLAAYRRLLTKTHPDKGGRKEDVVKLQAAKEDWDKALPHFSSLEPYATAVGDSRQCICF